MAAYAALVTLSKAIHQILPYEKHYSFLSDKHQMQSLHDKVIRLQVFLEDISGKSSAGIDDLESRIRDVAHRLEDIIESILVYSLAMDYENEVNSQLSIQGAKSHLPIEQANTQSSTGEANTQLPLTAEGRVVSKKSFFRGLVNKLCIPCCGCSTVKGGTDSQISYQTTETDLESEQQASLVDILGWCLDNDFINKAKYSHLPMTEYAAAAFGNYVEEADLLLEHAMEMRKILDNKLGIVVTSIYSHNIATRSLARGQPDANGTMVGFKDILHQILDRVTNKQRPPEVIPNFPSLEWAELERQYLLGLCMIITESKLTSILCLSS